MNKSRVMTAILVILVPRQLRRQYRQEIKTFKH